MVELRPEILRRDGYRCRCCGRAEHEVWTLEVHHRLIRKHGGPDTRENLVTLCGPNPAGCHGHVHQHPTWSYDNGLLIRSHAGAPDTEWESPNGLLLPAR